MSKKFIYVNTDGFNEESAGAFESADFISTSAGSADAGKPIVLDADGNIDASMINDADIDHGSISGLSDDDHTQYILVDGTRDFSGVVEYASHPTFSIDTQIVDKKYVDDYVAANLQALEWQDSALDYVVDNTLAPASENLGDRYILSADGGAPHADYDGASAGDIVEFDGTSWIATSPSVGMKIEADDEPTVIYSWSGSAWVQKHWEKTTASTGLTLSGYDVQLADAIAADGIQVSSGAISAVVDNASIEINGSEQLAVKADGINDTHIDFGTGANQVNDADLPIVDANNYFDASTVAGALDELYEAIDKAGVDYSVATSVAKGDLVYISANDTVATYDTITAAERCPGLAAAAASSGEIKVLANDVVLEGVLTAATAGDIYYWTGSAYSTSIPAGSGGHVWKVGMAKNATDLHVEVEFVKKNA